MSEVVGVIGAVRDATASAVVGKQAQGALQNTSSRGSINQFISGGNEETVGQAPARVVVCEKTLRAFLDALAGVIIGVLFLIDSASVEALF